MESKGKKIIDKIKKEHVVPESRFKLNWKNYSFWAILILLASIGSLFFSFIIINLLDIRPEMFRQIGTPRLFFLLLQTAPYLWITLSLLALIAGLVAFRKTKKGYRYSIISIVSIGVLLVSILGITLHMTGINGRLGKKIPGARKLSFPIEGRWSHPEEKMLGGEIVEISSDNFMLVNFMDEIWEVEYSKNTKMADVEKLKVGLKVGVIGEKIGEKKFRSEIIHKLPQGAFPGRGKMYPQRKFKNKTDLPPNEEEKMIY